MKTDTNEIALQKTEQVLHLEELILGLQRPEIIAELQELVDDTEKGDEELDIDQIVQDGEILLGIITEQVRAKRIWQIVTACFMIFVVITSFICFGLYLDRENQIEKLGIAEANIQKTSNDFAQADQKVKTLENRLSNSKAELDHTQSRLNNSSLEVENLQDQLADTAQRLKALQNRNVEAVKRLNGRLRKLSEQPAKTTKSN